jgi:C-terminal processing protease CtpA/Prc
MGLGGYLEGYIGRIQNLSLGEIDFSGVLTSFQDIEETWLMDKDRYRNGILGNQLLSRFNIYFDYIREQIHVKPYRTFRKPFQMDRSGLVIFAYGQDFNKFIIKDIIDKSPAQEADLREDDIILKIQGFPGKFYTLDGLNHLFQKKPGKRIRLVVLREGEVLRKEFILRDLI